MDLRIVLRLVEFLGVDFWKEDRCGIKKRPVIVFKSGF